jgi:hypothetical protein
VLQFLVDMAENNNTGGGGFVFTYTSLPFFAIAVIGVASNVLLLVALGKDPLKCFRNSGTYFVMNLSVSDTLTCILAPFFQGKTNWHPYLDYAMACSSFASIISILSISIDRFFLIAFPLRHRLLVKGKLVVTWLAGVWIMSLILPITILFYGLKKNLHFYQYAFCKTVIILSVLIYASTYCKLKKQSRNIALQNSNESRAQELRIIKEKQFLRTIILIACITFFCTMPSLAFFQISDPLALNRKNFVVDVFQSIFLGLFMVNFAVNPIIYVIRLPNYRKTFRILYYRTV